MWDIKHRYWTRLRRTLLAFHLNHVGYKVRLSAFRCNLTLSFIWTMWDIKSERNIRPMPAYPSFIWTMWDIKHSHHLLPLRNIYPFHLNHVGYKGCDCKGNRQQFLSFIWTMWDIKQGSWNGLSVLPSDFHLNHVGYKVLFCQSLKIACISFIWTMWDIKLGQCCQSHQDGYLSSEPCGI